jgi:large subunit ribosomal protein L6
MSRIGNKPIEVPSGVTIDVANDNTVSVKGPKGELSHKFNADIKINLKENEITVERPSDHKEHRALHGTTRSVINNMVIGVTNGYERALEIIGVGYRASKSGNKLILNAGYSHPVEIVPEQGIDIEVPSNTKVIVKGIDKQRVGEVAANIRSVRPPEPYKGKGIRYEGEFVRRKEGKTGK